MDLSLTDFKLQIMRQGGLYIAYSHSLDVATTGKSEQQAVQHFGDLARFWMKALIDHEHTRPGALDHKLLEMGWTKRARRWSPPVIKQKTSA